MLLQLRDYIQRAAWVSLDQLSREFHIDKEALQPMLDIWITKGVIKSSQTAVACARACKTCRPERAIYYAPKSFVPDKN